MRRFLLCLTVVCLSVSAYAQMALHVTRALDQHKFTLGQLDVLEDVTGKASFADVLSGRAGAFVSNQRVYPNNANVNSAYWVRLRLDVDEPLRDHQNVIEFFDQTTDEVTAYLPDSAGKYVKAVAGSGIHFNKRLFDHKNFEFPVTTTAKGRYIYYFRIRSHALVNVVIVYRSLNYFFSYALSEYLIYGVFYGMIIIFSLHNLLMFLAVKRRQYLYYVFYILAVGFYEMCADGIAFQYLWPAAPVLNNYGYGIALYFVSFFALVFGRELLQVKQRAPQFNKLINYVLIARTAYFLYCLFVNSDLFAYKFIDIIPLSVSFAAGIYIYRKGFKAARFFVLAYAILFVGFILRALHALALLYFLPATVRYYSLTFCFVAEMVLLSFAIGDQVRILRKEKDEATDETIRQMELNAELKDSINQELERQVALRTEQLMSANQQLEAQAEEISRMNVLLELDNVELKHNIEKVTESRVLSTELDFEEFSAKYPDQETCFKFLSGLKWKDGYTCERCGNTSHCGGRTPHSRRCTKCSYEESAIHNTIFQNSRIPINKAFYLTYLMYSTNGTISSHQLAEKLQIRQSTCWTYALRIKKVMQEKKRVKNKGEQGWSTLVV